MQIKTNQSLTILHGNGKVSAFRNGLDHITRVDMTRVWCMTAL